MANLGRGAYEPPDDVHIFNGAEEDDDAEGSRLPLLIVIALFVLAAFGGVVWLAYTQGVARGRSDAPRTIAAEPGPAKVAAAQDASQTPNTGLKVYQQPAPADDQSDRQVAPPPSNTAPETDVVTPHTQEQAQEPPAPKAPPVTVKPAVVAKAPPPPEIRTTTTTSAPSPDAEATAPPAQLGVKAKAPPPPKAETAPAPKADAAPAPAAGGAYVLQIGAYKSEAEADTAWASYRAKHGATLSGYAKDVKQVDLGAKGSWYRLRVGSFASKAAAQELCGKLTAEGGACFPAK
jgi:cell division protein FtsN